MNLPLGGGRRLAPSVPFVISILALSLLVAAPAQTARGSPQAGYPQVVPTMLGGFRSAGPLAGSTPVLVTIGIPLENLQNLEYVTQQISTPGSSMYHHFLTQEQVRSYLPVAQYQSAMAYLASRGLRVISTALDSSIVAEGTASQVSQALGLRYEVYTNGSSTYYSSSGSSPVAGAYLYSSNVTEVYLHHPPDLASGRTLPAMGSGRGSDTNQTIPIEGYPLPDLATAYNATALYASGDKGAGYTVGILDFYGDPYIAKQLQFFDQAYNLPSSPFKVVPIGPYNPSLGVYTTWDTEISLDVESVHSMAPGAGIDLYIGNGALSIAAAIAPIVQDDQVNVVTQSFGYPEGVLAMFGATALEMNVVLADQYYMLGSAEGITFTASTGDSGGAGFSGGPEGTPGYPATSPYNVAVGGTTTYLTYSGGAVSSAYQTAWSSYGFVPFQQNYGGGTGGVSVLEPTPWYQSGLPVPQSFPAGRLVPDVSLNAGIFPAVEVILPGNLTALFGGTSESTQLFGGLLTLLMGSSKSGLGLLNPSLYSFQKSPSVSAKVYYPITFGYNIPWTVTSGYNLVTGLGAPNMGEMARYIDSGSSGSLAVNVTATEKGVVPEDILPGQSLNVSAAVTQGGATVSTGKFAAHIDTLAGAVASVPLSYQASTNRWTGVLTVPANAAGLSYITVNGTSGGASGTGFAQVFSGYLATFLSPSSDGTVSTQFGIPLELNITTLNGNQASGSFTFSASSYSMKSNTYSKVATIPLSKAGPLEIGSLAGSYPDGPMVLSGNGALYGFMPIINGVSLQPSFIEPTVLAEPGAVGPGQSLYILANLQSPANTPADISSETNLPVSFNVIIGSNVTAALVSPTGEVVARSTLYVNTYLSNIEAIQGSLIVPSGVTPGIYHVMLNSSYYSGDLGTWINGSYFGQVYVASSLTTTATTITPPSALFEGQSVTVSAKITYANGTDVKYGMYAATIYPDNLKNSYNVFSQYVSIPMWYDTSSGLWVGNATLPSAYNSGGTIRVDEGALYLSGPFDVFISGVSADGVPSNTDISTQQPLQVQPYLYVSGPSVASLPQSSGVAFENATIAGASAAQQGGIGTLSNDVFIGSNTVRGTVTISGSQIQGTLNLENANVTLIGVTGGSVVASSSNLVIERSSLNFLSLSNSHVSMNASVVRSVSPQLPTVTIQSPASNAVYGGTSGSFTVSGTGISTVTAYVDGVLVQTYSPASSYSLPLNGGSMPVGVHSLEVVATQSDGLSTSAVVYFSTNGPLTTLNSSLGSLTTQVSSQASSQNARISSLSSQLSTANELSYALGGIAVLALVVAVVALIRRRPAQMAPAPGPAPVPQSGPAESPPPVPPQEEKPPETQPTCTI